MQSVDAVLAKILDDEEFEFMYPENEEM